MFKEPGIKAASARKPQKRKTTIIEPEPGKKASLGETYQDYLQFAEQLQREALVGGLPFWVLGLLAFLFNSQLGNFIATTIVRLDLASIAGEIGDVRLQWLLNNSQFQADLNAKLAILQSNSELALNIFALMLVIAGFLWTQRRMKEWVTEEDKYTPGFKDFFQRGYGFFRKGRAWGRYWPKALPQGERLEEFRRIIRRSQ